MDWPAALVPIAVVIAVMAIVITNAIGRFSNK